ncbi:MAG: ParA family protein, partial [Sphingomonas sp.]
MRTITLNIEKGGVGKTTLACHLAWYLAERGNRVVVLDLDQQGNATSTLTGYEKPDDGPDEGPKVPFSVIGSIESLFRP